ncbi:phosphate-starvation-inducible PsiE family protein [Geminocystis sp. CENA526]|uniref:phosphate-starvation-inducible PsiE family protein n=1 Tax=Geminocystis sp. CENA526 TaxID=1355871 RepID=UPI003D6FA775
MLKILAWLEDFFKDRNFLKVIHITENLVSKVLSLALIVVIFVALYDLVLVLITDLFKEEPIGFFNRTLIELFGFFLNILIALELLENITVYLRKHIVQLELVLTTALIAVARKIIIFDPSKYQKVDLISLGLAIVCLAISYGIIRYVNNDKKF